MSIDDRIRTATRATADTVHGIRPLAPLDDPARPRRPRQRRAILSQAWGGWLIPVAAAVAVIVLAAVLVAVRDLPGFGHAAGHTKLTTGGAANLPTYGAVLTAAEVRVPPQVGSGDTALNYLTVFNTRTAKPLTTVKPPKYTGFTAVSAAADDRTFALAALNIEPQELPGTPGLLEDTWSFYLLRIAPGTSHPATLTKLSIPGQPQDAVIAGFALAPDGKTLAVDEWCTQAPCKGAPGTLRLYSVATGQVLRDWTWGATTDPLPSYGDSTGLSENRVGLTWLTGGQVLEFTYYAHGQPPAIRQLITGLPSGDLVDRSSSLFTLPQGGADACAEAMMTPDGRTAVCGTQPPPQSVCNSTVTETLEVDAYSVVTRKREAVLYRHTSQCAWQGVGALGWVGPGGTVVIVRNTGSLATSDLLFNSREVLDAITHGKQTQLLPPSAYYGQGPGSIAF